MASMVHCYEGYLPKYFGPFVQSDNVRLLDFPEVSLESVRGISGT